MKQLIPFLLFLVPINSFSQTCPPPEFFDSRVIPVIYPFLQASPDVRGSGMGNAGVATSNSAFGGFWNIAKAPLSTKKMQVGISNAPWYAQTRSGQSIKSLYGHFNFGNGNAILFSANNLPLGNIVIIDSLGITQGTVKLTEYAYQLGYARKLGEKSSMGIGFSSVGTRSSNDFRESEQLLAGYVGLFSSRSISSNTELSFGVSINNMGARVIGERTQLKKRNYLPTNLRIGGALQKDLNETNSLTFALDLSKLLVPTPPIYERARCTGAILTGLNGQPLILSGHDPDQQPDGISSINDAPGGFQEEIQEVSINTGLEYIYREKLLARLGYAYQHKEKGNNRYFTMGAGYKTKLIALDVAYLNSGVSAHPQDETIQIGLSVTLGE